MLRVAYVNVRGLGASKLRYIHRQYLDRYDLVILAETWEMSLDIARTHPSYIESSPITRFGEGRRADGGLLVLARPDIAAQVRATHTSPYFITVTHLAYTITGVYLPPSLDQTAFANALSSIPVSSMILGDINVRYGRLFNDTHTGPAPKIREIAVWTQHRLLEHLHPISGYTRVDHVFRHSSLDPTHIEYNIIDAGVPTDHPAIDVRINAPPIAMPSEIAPAANRPAVEQATATRFHLAPLRDELRVRALITAYESCARDFDDDITTFETYLPHMNVHARCDGLDWLDEQMLQHIHTAAHAVLGTYNAGEARTKVDRTMDELKADAKAPKVAQTFKRACRVHSSRLEPEDPTLTLSEEVGRHFASIFTPNGTTPDTPDLLDPKYGFTQHQSQNFGTGDVEIAARFTRATVERFFKRYKASKACGPDSLHTLIIRALLPSRLTDHIVRIFSLCAMIGLTPRRWNDVSIHPLAKVANAKYISQCRPIALSSMLRRCFEHHILKHMETNSSCARLRSFSRLQAGFRRGFSTITQAAASHDYGVRYPNILRAFVDFKQAYDRVPIPRLLEKIERREGPVGLRSILISLFTRCRLLINANGAQICTIETRRGLLQGSLLAPFLFDVFIDDLARALDNQADLPGALLFADDVQVLGLTRGTIQAQLDRITDWTTANGMTVGIAKCGYIADRPFDLQLCGMAVPRCAQYRYLGFPHQRRCISFESHIERLTLKASGTLRRCRQVGRAWPESVRLAVVKAFIRPVLEYGMPLIAALLLADPSLRLLAPIKKVMDDATHWCIPYAVSPAHAAPVLGIVPPECRARGLAASFIHHIAQMSADNPARTILQHWQSRLPCPSNALMERVARAPVYQEVCRISDERQIKWPLALRYWYVGQLEEKSAIARYISVNARTRTFGPDRCIYWLDDTLRSTAIKWRIGFLSQRTTCRGGHILIRRCLLECANPQIRLPPIDPLKIPRNPPATFGPADAVLNGQRSAAWLAFLNSIPFRA
jgi:hypothetical protein